MTTPRDRDLAHRALRLAEWDIPELTERFNVLHDNITADGPGQSGALELLAVGAALARFYTGARLIQRALYEGCTWDDIAAARGADPAELRLEYGEWVAAKYEAGQMTHVEFDDARRHLMPAQRNHHVGEALERTGDLIRKINGGAQ